MYKTKRERYDIIKSQLDTEFSSFRKQYQDLADYILPNRARFLINDGNKGDRRNHKILDPTATMAARTLRSGMMSGITSPARPWFRLTTADSAMAEFGPVKSWLHVVSERMNAIFLRSNLYNILPTVYGDLGTFGTAPYSIEEDIYNVVHFSSFPIGSFRIGKDERGIVNVFYREFRMTVRQILQKFAKRGENGKYDLSNLSDFVKRNYEAGRLEEWVEVSHFIGPNPEFNPKKLESKFKKFESTYYEKSSSGKDIYLSEKGYDYFPIMCPRWEVTSEDVYGTSCPGMVAIGDVKQLQFGEKKIMQAIDKLVNPPLIGPTVLQNSTVSLLPGGITFDDTATGNNSGLRPIYQINPQIQHLIQKQSEVKERINTAFYADLFLMLEQMERQMTATEVAERKEEKLVALGPVLEQFNQDGLDPLIDNTFDIMMRQNTNGRLLPEPPQELQGAPLKVEYISIMAQAQKTVGIGGIERFMTFTGNLAAARPEAWDKVNVDQVLDIYGDMTSIPPSIIRSDDEVQAIRQQQQQAQQQAAQMQAMQQTASTAKDLSQANTDGQNALTELIDRAKAGDLTA